MPPLVVTIYQFSLSRAPPLAPFFTFTLPFFPRCAPSLSWSENTLLHTSTPDTFSLYVFDSSRTEDQGETRNCDVLNENWHLQWDKVACCWWGAVWSSMTWLQIHCTSELFTMWQDLFSPELHFCIQWSPRNSISQFSPALLAAVCSHKEDSQGERRVRKKQDDNICWGVDLSQFNMCSGCVMLPGGGLAETRAGSASKASRVRVWIRMRRKVTAKEESSLMRPFWSEVETLTTMTSGTVSFPQKDFPAFFSAHPWIFKNHFVSGNKARQIDLGCGSWWVSNQRQILCEWVGGN